MISSQIQVTDRFPEITLEVEQLAVRALDAAAQTAAQTARQVASRRRKTGRMSDFEAIPAAGSEDGYASGIRNDPGAWYDRFQNYGTAGNRRRKLKASTLRRRESPSGQARQQRFGTNRGIEPLGFLEAARREGRRELLRIIENGL